MKKKKISGLSLNKKTVSSLNKSAQDNIVGGNTYPNGGSYDPNCCNAGSINCHLSAYACNTIKGFPTCPN